MTGTPPTSTLELSFDEPDNIITVLMSSGDEVEHTIGENEVMLVTRSADGYLTVMWKAKDAVYSNSMEGVSGTISGRFIAIAQYAPGMWMKFFLCPKDPE